MKSILPWCLIAVTLSSPAFAKGRGDDASALNSSTQMIVVTTQNWSAVDGQLQAYQRVSRMAPWTPVGDPIPVVVGRAGMGWGMGAVPIDVRSTADPVKHEGDHRSPAGVFHLGSAFGYAPEPSDGWKLHYIAIQPSTYCVDDPRSRHYNQVLDAASVASDWNSAEHMRDAGEAYRWGLIVQYNTPNPQPGSGSCVFLHIWDGAGNGTAGCTAMSEPQLTRLLMWVNPAASPLLVQMPATQYRSFAIAMSLPALR